MLVLSRKLNEKILFPALNASVQVVSVKPGVVRLGIDAPPEVTVLREEIHQQAAEWDRSRPPPGTGAAEARLRELNHLLRNRLNAATVGLGLLRRQQQMGLAQESEVTLTRVEEEIHSLRQHLENTAAPARPLPPARPSRARKALLVEDDHNERELLAGFLRLAGLDVITVADGLAALDYLHAHARPDVVLLDLGLPRCDGATTLREIRRDPAYTGLKVFAVTGRSPDEFAIDNARLSVDRWFPKPLNPEALLQGLNQELAGLA